MNAQIDHFLTFTNVESIDNYVEHYRALGFSVSDETRPYKPGLRNRFVQLGCEYLELVWVENEEVFARGDTEEFARMFTDLPTLRQAARPFSIAFISDTVEVLHQHWTQRGYNVPLVWSFAPPGMPPILSFQEIPGDILPGASCFAITYHGSSTSQARTVQRAANTTYAVEGITLVSTTPEDSARQWQTLLNPNSALTAVQQVYTVTVPPHRVWWMAPHTYETRYGVAWRPASHGYGHIAAIHLLAENLAVASAICGPRVQNRITTDQQDELLIVSPTDEDGVTFIIREYPLGQWLRERSSASGEMIEVL